MSQQVREKGCPMWVQSWTVMFLIKWEDVWNRCSRGLSLCYSVLSLLTQRSHHRRSCMFDIQTNEVWYIASTLEVKNRIPYSCDKLEIRMENFLSFLTSTSVSITLRNNDLHRQNMWNGWGGRNSDRKEHRNDSWEQPGRELTTSCCCQHRVSFWNVESRQVCRGTLLLEQHW